MAQLIIIFDSFIETKHKIKSKSISILGIIPKDFPYCLPLFYLCGRSSYGLLAHVVWPEEYNSSLFCDSADALSLYHHQCPEKYDLGLICNGSDDALSLNYHCPEKLYSAALDRALSTITPIILDKQVSVN